MSCKKLVVLGSSITIAGLLSSAVYAKQIYPGFNLKKNLNCINDGQVCMT